MKVFSSRVLLGTIFVLLCAPASGSAALFEWATEGSYVHQFTHLMFLIAMLSFIREMYRGGLQETLGFRYLIWACWLLVLWNLDALIGHTIDWSLRNPLILGEGLSRRLVMEDTRTWAYYFHRLNHFLLLPPAFFLFYLGLKRLARESQTKRP